MSQDAALLDSSSAGQPPAAHHDKSTMAAATFAMIYFCVGCSWAVPVGNILAQFLQPLGTCCRMRGPADVCNTYQVRLFSFEPAQPVRSHHHTQLADHLHTPHGPTRPALVDRADFVYEGSSRCFRGTVDIHLCSQTRALCWHGFLMCQTRPARIIVRVSTRSVCHARG